MIKKLRVRLIALSMFALFLVLSIMIGTVNIINYQQTIAQADDLLDVLAANNGRIPLDGGVQPGQREIPKDTLTPETPYESRYFSVVLTSSGEPIQVDTGNIAAIDSETAVDMAKEVLEKGHTTGLSGSYRYLVQTDDHSTRLIFLDCSRNLSTCRTFLVTSVAISLLGMLAVFLLLLLLSGRIVRPMAESYEKQRQFITDAGHELKTPLTIIHADTEVLALEIGENQWLQDIQGQTQRMAALTEDLMVLARMDEAQPLELAECSLSQAVEETATPFVSLATSQEKELFLELCPEITLKGNERALRQLTSILLDNAVKYTPAGGKILLSLQRQGKGAVLSVTNPSATPLPQRLDQLFQRFYRTDPSRNSQTGGHGIGLSIAKAIVSAHRGKIEATSPDGVELKISVWIPLS
jgi:signal transduction histidine kinase